MAGKVSQWADSTIDAVRNGIPTECSKHPLVSQVLKLDHTLLRCLALKAMRRQALRTAYTPTFKVHPVDAVRAWRSCKTQVIMRLVIYNEVKKAKHSCQIGIPATEAQMQKALLRRLLAQAKADGEVSYSASFFRHNNEYARMDGWVRFLQMLKDQEGSNSSPLPPPCPQKPRQLIQWQKKHQQTNLVAEKAPGD